MFELFLMVYIAALLLLALITLLIVLLLVCIVLERVVLWACARLLDWIESVGRPRINSAHKPKRGEEYGKDEEIR